MVVGEFTQEADLVVIGGGPGGYSAAFRAAELGQSVVIVDSREALGGVCLHEGCVPSKTLLNIADVINAGLGADKFGVEFGEPSIDPDQIRQWNQSTIDKLASGLESLCKKHNVDHIQGRAYFEDSRILHILDGSIPRVRFRRAIIATGSTPKPHPKLPFEGNVILSPEDASKLPSIPHNLLVLGSDYLAAEMASMYAALGSKVWLVAEEERLLSEVDKDIVRPLQKSLAGKLEGLHFGCAVTDGTIKDQSVSVTFEGKKAPDQNSFDAIIVCLGRESNLGELQIDKTSVTLDETGFITIDEQMRTSDGRIFALGDVTGPPLLANKAIHQGRICAEIIAGRPAGFDARAIPHAIYTDPQIAWCGMTEAQAKDLEIKVSIKKIPWGASGLAMGMGRTDGLTKLIYDPITRELLGAAITGAGAVEMISEAALAIEMGAVMTDLGATLHPHPSRSELLCDAAHQVDADEEA